MKHMRYTATALVLCLLASMSAAQDADKPLPTITSKVEKLQKIDGYMPLYWQASAGKLFMEIGALQPGAALSGLAAGRASAPTRSASIAASSGTPASSRSSASDRRS